MNTNISRMSFILFLFYVGKVRVFFLSSETSWDLCIEIKIDLAMRLLSCNINRLTTTYTGGHEKKKCIKDQTASINQLHPLVLRNAPGQVHSSAMMAALVRHQQQSLVYTTNDRRSYYRNHVAKLLVAEKKENNQCLFPPQVLNWSKQRTWNLQVKLT